MKSQIQQLYDQYYVQLGFERLGLFTLIQEHCQPQTVLYPGSSIHITPSLVFPHVVYVDKSPLAQQFFADKAGIEDYINHRKHYQRSAFIQFIGADFCAPLPLCDHSFDLLLSLFSGPQIAACQRYLRNRGWVLTSGIFSDQDYVAHHPQFKRIAWIAFQQGRYQWFDQPPPKAASSTLKNMPTGLTYVDREIYVLYGFSTPDKPMKTKRGGNAPFWGYRL